MVDQNVKRKVMTTYSFKGHDKENDDLVGSECSWKLGKTFLVPDTFMSTGHVPQAWKQTTVTPVFKGGIASDPSNYRPISLTSVFSKLMERVVVLNMLRYCKEQGLISK